MKMEQDSRAALPNANYLTADNAMRCVFTLEKLLRPEKWTGNKFGDI